MYFSCCLLPTLVKLVRAHIYIYDDDDHDINEVKCVT